MALMHASQARRNAGPMRKGRPTRKQGIPTVAGSAWKKRTSSALPCAHHFLITSECFQRIAAHAHTRDEHQMMTVYRQETPRACPRAPSLSKLRADRIQLKIAGFVRDQSCFSNYCVILSQ
jgi:hypothetical protein